MKSGTVERQVTTNFPSGHESRKDLGKDIRKVHCLVEDLRTMDILTKYKKIPNWEEGQDRSRIVLDYSMFVCIYDSKIFLF